MKQKNSFLSKTEPIKKNLENIIKNLLHIAFAIYIYINEVVGIFHDNTGETHRTITVTLR